MKKRKEFLQHIYRNRRTYTWIVIFLIFLVATSRRMPLLASLLMSTISISPMLAMTELLRRVLIPRFLQKSRLWYYLYSFITILLLSTVVVSIDTRIYGYLFNHNLVNLPEETVIRLAMIEERVGKDILYTKYIILLCITFAVVTISHMLDETKRLEQETKVQSMMQELK